MANKYTDAVHFAQLPGDSKNRVTLKAILMAMAFHTDNKTGIFWGGYSTFAHEANCSREAVKKNVPTLIKLNLLTIIGEKPTRFGPCHKYRMNIDELLKLADQGIEAPGEDTGSEPTADVGTPYGDPIATPDQGTVAPPPGSSIPPTRLQSTPHQGIQDPENSFLNSTFNSPSNSKDKVPTDALTSQRREVSQSQKQQPTLPAQPESVELPSPVEGEGFSPSPASLPHPGTYSSVSSPSARPGSAVLQTPKRVCGFCGGPLKKNSGDCLKCGHEPIANQQAKAVEKPKVWKDQYGLVVPGLPHTFAVPGDEAPCVNQGCQTNRMGSMYDADQKYCDYAPQRSGGMSHERHPR
jgi:hypothetical protein